MKPGSVFEKRLLSRVVLRKDPEAYAQLYDRYVTDIYRFVYFKVGSVEVAEDLTSDVFLKTWDYILKISDTNEQKIRNFRSLLYKISRNRVIDYYRKRARSKEVPLDNHAFGFVWDDSIHDKVAQDSDLKYLLSKLKSLKYEYQEILLLRYFEGLSIKDIAVILEKKTSNIRVLLHRAEKKLKQLSESSQSSHG